MFEYSRYSSTQGPGSHYSLAHCTDLLAAWSHDVAGRLPGVLGGRRPIFCYRGMSGISHATALSIAYLQRHDRLFGMIYVRKPEELSNGKSVESNLKMVQSEPCRLVFVDDFVSSGKTRSAVLLAATAHIIRPAWYSSVPSLDNFDSTTFVEATFDVEPYTRELPPL